MKEKELLAKLDQAISGIEAQAAKYGCDWSRDVHVLNRVFDGAANQLQALRTERTHQNGGAPRTPRA